MLTWADSRFEENFRKHRVHSLALSPATPQRSSQAQSVCRYRNGSLRRRRMRRRGTDWLVIRRTVGELGPVLVDYMKYCRDAQERRR